MTKTELQSSLAEVTQTDKRTAGVFLDTLSALAYKEIRKNGEFVLPGFGKLVKQKRKARTGFNPKTQQKIKIPAKTVVFYKCTSVLSLKNVTIAQFLLCSGDGAPDSAATSDRGRSS